jgi:hypothetical protein
LAVEELHNASSSVQIQLFGPTTSSSSFQPSELALKNTAGVSHTFSERENDKDHTHCIITVRLADLGRGVFDERS